MGATQTTAASQTTAAPVMSVVSVLLPLRYLYAGADASGNPTSVCTPPVVLADFLSSERRLKLLAQLGTPWTAADHPMPPARSAADVEHMPEATFEQRLRKCGARGHHRGKCSTCNCDITMLPGAVTSALVDGFSGPLDIAVVSCIGEPHSWNMVAGLCGRAGLSFCCYWRPDDTEWKTMWQSNVAADAAVSKESCHKQCIAITYEGGEPGYFMRKDELPYLEDQGITPWMMPVGGFLSFLADSGLLIRRPHLFTVSWDKTVVEWSLEGNLLRPFSGHTEAVRCVDATTDGVLTGSRDKTIKWWSRQTGALVRTFAGHRDEVLCAVMSNGAPISGSSDQTIKEWHLETGECVLTSERLGSPVVSVVATPSHIFAMTAASRVVRLCRSDRPVAKVLETIVGNCGGWCDKTGNRLALRGPSLFVVCPTLRLVREVHWGTGVQQSGRDFVCPPMTFEGKPDPLRSVASTGEFLLASGRSPVVYKFSTKTQDLLATFDVQSSDPAKPLTKLVAAGEHFYVGYRDLQEVGMFAVRDGRRSRLPEGAFKGHSHGIQDFAMG
mmetsp:Transcript_21708/g.61550  ORF Transcript_21708/g.61550 Transcript_21708/m.61550 type:complete len:555 (+) Transcript_21708:124-1788(+)